MRSALTELERHILSDAPFAQGKYPAFLPPGIGIFQQKKDARRASFFSIMFSGLGQGVFFAVHLVLLGEGFAAAAVYLHQLVIVHVGAAGLDDGACNVGAVVSHTLKVGEKVGPYKAGLDAALALLHTHDVAVAQLILQIVNHLLQRLDLQGDGDVVFQEGVLRHIHDLADGADEHFKLGPGVLAEDNGLLGKLLGRLHYVDGVVGDTLKVTDKLEKLCGLDAVAAADAAGAQLHKVGAKGVLIAVGIVFALADDGGLVLVVAFKGGDGSPYGVKGADGHVIGHSVAALQCHGRRGQQQLIQHGKLFCFLGIGDKLCDQLLKEVGHRQQHGGAQHVEDRVADGDAQHIRGHGQQRGLEHDLDYIEGHKADNCADDVESQMHGGGTAGVLGGAHGGEHGGDAGAHVLTHDDGDGRTEAYLPGHGQSLQNTHGGRGALDDAGEHGTGQHAQHRLLEEDEKLSEGRHILEPGHCAGHGVHAEHQCGKAQKHHAGVLLLAVLDEHVIDDTHESQHRGEGAGLQELDEDVAAVDAGKAQYPGGDGGAHVCAHDDVDGLLEAHDAGVDETDHHNGGGRGTLDDGGYAKTGEKACQLTAGHLAQQGAEAAAGTSFKGFAHDVHAEEEKAQAPDHSQYIKNVHIAVPF